MSDSPLSPPRPQQASALALAAHLHQQQPQGQGLQHQLSGKHQASAANLHSQLQLARSMPAALCSQDSMHASFSVEAAHVAGQQHQQQRSKEREADQQQYQQQQASSFGGSAYGSNAHLAAIAALGSDSAPGSAGSVAGNSPFLIEGKAPDALSGRGGMADEVGDGTTAVAGMLDAAAALEAGPDTGPPGSRARGCRSERQQHAKKQLFREGEAASDCLLLAQLPGINTCGNVAHHSSSPAAAPPYGSMVSGLLSPASRAPLRFNSTDDIVASAQDVDVLAALDSASAAAVAAAVAGESMLATPLSPGWNDWSSMAALLSPAHVSSLANRRLTDLGTQLPTGKDISFSCSTGVLGLQRQQQLQLSSARHAGDRGSSWSLSADGAGAQQPAERPLLLSRHASLCLDVPSSRELLPLNLSPTGDYPDTEDDKSAPPASKPLTLPGPLGSEALSPSSRHLHHSVSLPEHFSRGGDPHAPDAAAAERLPGEAVGAGCARVANVPAVGAAAGGYADVFRSLWGGGGMSL
eukprot:gene4741-4991_t